jgi:hypothetical protein
VFAEIGSNDREFAYRVLADPDSRIKNLMWTMGRREEEDTEEGDACLLLLGLLMAVQALERRSN